jgi:hypothetical protein
LVKIRTKAIRKGVWFRVLNRAERAQIELTVRVVKRVRSLLLIKVLTSLMTKLLTAFESKVERFARKVGRHLARKLGLIAQSWGNVSAFVWKTECKFVRYLAVLHMNTLGIHSP